MTLPATLPDVAAAILKLSDVFVGATVEYPGYIAVELDGGGRWNLGTANGTWGGELEIVDDGGIDRAIQTTLPPTHPNAEEIAAALFQAMADDSPWNGDDPDPNDCAECGRSFGPHYSGPCEH